ncbi:sugar phosphate isomerase/epimerase family protein [Natronobiforma cellulositropha]|uniref:sugar phosphate isomerase/epimerase family protein n=1 Tax=Natronobiforma cellulositropha TaxID=1679076 RepID=UPI0021D5EEB2|nr:sugar phosphate isomerase/epimerase [Natronobiforma cellulositropha]
MQLGLTVGDSLERIDALGEHADTGAEATPDLSVDFVELGIGEGVDPDSIDERRLERALEHAGTDLCVHLPFQQVLATTVPEIDEGIVAYQRRLLSWAGGVGAQKAVLHATARDPYDTDQRPVFAEQLAAIADAGRDAGVEVVVENVGHQKRGLQLSVLANLARETDTAVCFDVGHAYMEDGDDGVERFLKRDGDLISHLHVHDARRRGDTHIPIGAGEIDYSLVTDHLAGFDGTVAIEVFTDDHALLADSARRARATLETDDSQ